MGQKSEEIFSSLGLGDGAMSRQAERGAKVFLESRQTLEKEISVADRSRLNSSSEEIFYSRIFHPRPQSQCKT